jgi:mono/diheme cytochrome c family protein
MNQHFWTRWNGGAPRRAMLACGLATLAFTYVSCAKEAGPPPQGEELYTRYCASCHGLDGKGDGPVAPELRTRPSDLTTISRRHGGFDMSEVAGAIDGRRAVAAHGPREMPVWGAIFETELETEPHTARTGLLRTFELVEYLRSIQER